MTNVNEYQSHSFTFVRMHVKNTPYSIVVCMLEILEVDSSK